MIYGNSSETRIVTLFYKLQQFLLEVTQDKGPKKATYTLKATEQIHPQQRAEILKLTARRHMAVVHNAV